MTGFHIARVVTALGVMALIVLGNLVLPMLLGGGGGRGAAIQTGVRIRGLRELERPLGGAMSEFGRELRRALREAAEPIRADAARRASVYGTRTANGYAVSVRTGGRVSVLQRRQKTTGTRPHFGSLQMRRALLPALATHEDDVHRRVERALDEVLRRFRLT